MRIILKDVVLSYPKLFKADDKGKFGAAFVFRKGQEKQVKEIQKAALAVLVDKFGKEEATKMVKAGRVPIAGGKGATVRTDAGKYEDIGGIAYLNARTGAGEKNRPSVLASYADPSGRKNSAGKPVPAQITDERQIWAGQIVNASVTLYYKKHPENEGVWAALNGVQHVSDGDIRLDNRIDAADEFDVDPDAVATLDSLVDDDAESEDGDDLSELLG